MFDRDPAAQHLDDVKRLEAAICPLLAGLHPATQGAVLAALTGRWLAGHDEGEWSELVALQMQAVIDLAYGILDQDRSDTLQGQPPL